eukprot:6123083-Amphidinium_carterae.3
MSVITQSGEVQEPGALNAEFASNSAESTESFGSYFRHPAPYMDRQPFIVSAMRYRQRDAEAQPEGVVPRVPSLTATVLHALFTGAPPISLRLDCLTAV